MNLSTRLSGMISRELLYPGLRRRHSYGGDLIPRLDGRGRVIFPHLPHRHVGDHALLCTIMGLWAWAYWFGY